MKFSAVCSTLALAAVAIAAPADLEARTDKTIGQAAKECNANQVVSCCNTSSKTSNVGLLNGILGGGILSNSCTGVTAPILNILSGVSSSSVCGNSNSVKCCPNSQAGVVNVNVLQCSNIL